MAIFLYNKHQKAVFVPFDNEASVSGIVNVSGISGTEGFFISGNVEDALHEIDFRQIELEPTGFASRVNSTISFNDANRTFSITPIEAFIYYIRGKRHIVTETKTVQITDTEGLWFIYFEGDTLKASQTVWEFDGPIAFVSYLYWDATNNQAIIFGEERHGLTMDWATHKYLHNTFRTQVERNSFETGNYIVSGDGSLDTHAQISFTNGTIHDEDIIISVVNSATPTLPFEQKLSTIAYIPLYYKLWDAGLGINVWRKISATAFAVASNSPNTIYYNKLTTGQYSLTNLTGGYYGTTWIAATNNIYEPIIGILGQTQAASLSAANTSEENLDLSGFPFQEYKFLNRLVFQSDSSYTNSPKAALRTIGDISVPTSYKAGLVPATSFSGNPKAAAVVFVSPFSDNNYVIEITGQDGRSWIYQSKATTGFTINAQANKALTGEVSWFATRVGES